MKKLNVKAVTTKEKMIEALLIFHNIVNGRIGKKAFTRKEHDELYSRSNLYSICNNFFRVMSVSLQNEKALLNNFHRKKNVKAFEVWIRSNIHIFQC